MYKIKITYKGDTIKFHSDDGEIKSGSMLAYVIANILFNASKLSKETTTDKERIIDLTFH